MDDTSRLSTADAAAYLGIKPDVLRHWRTKPSPNTPFIPFHKVGGKYIYLEADLAEFLLKVRVEEASC